jgi:T5SS/PEP-CTERM-associated repeat protein
VGTNTFPILIGTTGSRGELIIGTDGILEVDTDSSIVSLAVGANDCGGGECARLIIQNGGVVFTNASGRGTSVIGSRGGEGSVFISGNGSEWTDSSLVTVGDLGGIGLLDIQNPGLFSGKALWLAFGDSSQGTVRISDAGSLLELEQELLMGLGAGGEAHFTISNSATVFIKSKATIAFGGEGEVTVEGNLSSLAVSDTTFIGKFGSGGLSVLDGGLAISNVAVMPGGNGGIGSALVDGGSSKWDVVGTLWIGQRGVGFVRVTNQGTLEAGAIHIGPLGSMDATGGTLIIGGTPPLLPNSSLSTTGGTVYVDTLLLSSGAQIMADSVIFQEGGYLGSEDTLSFDVINSGGINPGDSIGTAGVFTIDANYTQLSSGTLFIELGGLTPGDNHDQLAVTGNAQLTGKLDVSVINNFAPQVGQTFEILTAGSLTGTFEDVITQGNLGVDVTYNSNSVTITITSPLAIEDGDNENNLPKEYFLGQNYPNPFNPSTTIRFHIPISEFVTLKVYDLTGREVAILANEQKPAGSYSVEFDAGTLASGMYFYRLEASDFQRIRKMLLVR